MSTPVLDSPRRASRVGVIALIAAVAAVLAGCSSSPASAPYDDSNSDLAYGEAAAPGLDGGADTAGFSERSSSDRSVIINGSMYMTVEDPIVAADRAAGIVQNSGGRIDARSETAPDEYYSGSAALTMRIPSDKLDTVVDRLRDLGTVDQFSTESYDVTVEVADLEARISTLRASTTRIEGLLVNAKDISDIITLENELTYRQAELQSLEAQQRGLDDQVSMSTINLSLTTEPVVIVEEDSPDTFWDALKSGWSDFVGFLSGALILLGVALPWIAALALILVPVIVSRTRKSRAAGRVAAATTPAASVKPAASRK